MSKLLIGGKCLIIALTRLDCLWVSVHAKTLWATVAGLVIIGRALLSVVHCGIHQVEYIVHINVHSEFRQNGVSPYVMHYVVSRRRV